MLLGSSSFQGNIRQHQLVVRRQHKKMSHHRKQQSVVLAILLALLVAVDFAQLAMFANAQRQRGGRDVSLRTQTQRERGSRRSEPATEQSEDPVDIVVDEVDYDGGAALTISIDGCETITTSGSSGHHFGSCYYCQDPYLDLVHFNHFLGFYACSPSEAEDEYSLKKQNKFFGFLHYSDSKTGDSSSNLNMAAYVMYKTLDDDQLAQLISAMYTVSSLSESHRVLRGNIINLLHGVYSHTEEELQIRMKDFMNVGQEMLRTEAAAFQKVGMTMTNDQHEKIQKALTTTQYDSYDGVVSWCSGLSTGQCEAMTAILGRCLTFWGTDALDADLIDRGYFADYFSWATLKNPITPIEKSLGKSVTGCSEKKDKQLATSRDYLANMVAGYLTASQIQALLSIREESGQCICDIATLFRETITTLYSLKDGVEFDKVADRIDLIFSIWAQAETCYVWAQAQAYMAVFSEDKDRVAAAVQDWAATSTNDMESWYQKEYSCS